jgi:hypothetical protein
MDANLSLKKLLKEDVVNLDLEKSDFLNLKKKVLANQLKGFAFLDINYLKKLIDFVEKKAQSKVVGLNTNLIFTGWDGKTKVLVIAYSVKQKVKFAVLAGYLNEIGEQDLKFKRR